MRTNEITMNRDGSLSQSGIFHGMRWVVEAHDLKTLRHVRHLQLLALQQRMAREYEASASPQDPITQYAHRRGV